MPLMTRHRARAVRRRFLRMLAVIITIFESGHSMQTQHGLYHPAYAAVPSRPRACPMADAKDADTVSTATARSLNGAKVRPCCSFVLAW
jgi:hypothetical protein